MPSRSRQSRFSTLSAPLAPDAWERLEEVLQRFEAAGRNGEHPVIEKYLEGVTEQRLELLVELVHTELELRLRAGESARVEEYLARFPELAGHAAVVIDLATAEFKLRCQHGMAPTPQEYLERFPEQAESLRSRLGLEPVEEPANPIPRTLAPPNEGSSRPSTKPRADENLTVENSPPARSESESSLVSLLTPHVVPPGYVILEELGKGAMGVVYKARQRALGRVVALKMIKNTEEPNPEERRRFEVEAEAIARLQHPGIVQIYEIGEHEGQQYLALEYCPGGNLASEIRGTTLPARRAAEIIEQMAQAMEAVHRCHIIHRDLKPANVLLSAEGQPKITDFGLAKKLDDVALTEPGRVMGTPCYLAPEQITNDLNEVGPPADIYGLSATLYELLTGRPPFKAPSVWETLEQVRRRDPQPPRRLQPTVPRDLETICLKGLMKDPSRRYHSARELAEDLRRFLHGEPVWARPVGVVERGLKWARRKPAQALLAVAVLVSVATTMAGLAFYARSKDREAEIAQQRAESAQQRFASRRSIDDHVSAAQREEILGQQALAAHQEGEAREHFKKAEDHCKNALALLSGPGAEPDEGRRKQIEETEQRVTGQLAEWEHRQQLEEHRGRLRDGRDRVLSYQLDLFNQDREENNQQVRRQARETLAAFNLRPDTPPAQVTEFLKPYRNQLAQQPDQGAWLPEGCYELLLAWAEAEAATKPGPEVSRQDRARLALQLLGLAEAMGKDFGLPTPRAYHTRKARYLNQAGELAEAGRERAVAARVQPSTALDHFLRALDAWRLQDYTAVATACDETLRLQNDHLGALYLQALRHMRYQHWDAARAELTAYLAVSRGHNPFGAYLLRGYARGMLGLSDAAEEDFTQALKEAGKDPLHQYVVLTNRGVIRLHFCRLNEAQTDLERAIGLSADPYQAYADLAHVHWTRARLVRIGFALLGGDLAQTLHVRQELQTAAHLLDKALAARPIADQRGRILSTRGWVWVELGEADSARRDFEAAVAQPGDKLDRAKDYVELAALRYRDHQYQAALDACDEALRLDPDYPPAHGERAMALIRLGRTHQAKRELDQYLQHGTPLPALCEAQGLLHNEDSEHEAAVGAYTRAIALEPTARRYCLRGWSYLKLGATHSARDDFDKALNLDPRYADALCGRGIARASLGQVAAAVADADAAYRYAPRNKVQTLFGMACIYARVAGHLATRVNARYPAEMWAVNDHRDRAVRLLFAALQRLPQEERSRFWQKHVRGEPSLASLRNNPNFRYLESQYGDWRRASAP